LWTFLNTPLEALLRRAARLAESFRADLGLNASVEETTAFLGGGSVPLAPIPTAAVRVGAPFPPPFRSATGLARALPPRPPPGAPRLHDGAVLLDLRAIPEADDSALEEAVARLLGRRPGRPGEWPERSIVDAAGTR